MPSLLEESKGLLVRRWGEMSGYWGINRTMAELHALLFVSTEQLCTDDVMAQLHISRGNASMNLRALVDWGLIRRVHKLGERREFFQADTDVWHMFETILRERRRREVEPIVSTIDRCIELAAPLQAADAPSSDALQDYRRRLSDLRQFLHTLSVLFELVLQYGSDGLERLARSFRPEPSAGSPSAAEPAGARIAPPTERRGARAARAGQDA